MHRHDDDRHARARSCGSARIELDADHPPAGDGGVGGRPAADRQAAAAARRVRLHRRRGRGRAGAGQQQRRPSPASSSARGCCDRSARSIRRPPCSAARCRSRSCWRRPASRGSPTRRASWPWRGPPHGPSLPYTLSTLATRSIEEVAAVSDGRRWFQVYAWRDRGLVKEMIDRCADVRLRGAGADGRHRRARSARARRAAGVRDAPEARLGTLLDGAVHPGWTWAFVRSEPIMFANVVGRGGDGPGDGTDPVSLSGVRQQPVRPGPVVGRRRVAALDVVRPDRDQGHPVGGRCRARRGARRRGHRPVEPRRPPARLGPGADRSRGAGGRGGRRTASRSSATAACGGAATSSRRSRSVRRRAWPGGPTCTGSARPASAASTTCSGCSQADVRRTMALVGAEHDRRSDARPRRPPLTSTVVAACRAFRVDGRSASGSRDVPAGARPATSRRTRHADSAHPFASTVECATHSAAPSPCYGDDVYLAVATRRTAEADRRGCR